MKRKIAIMLLLFIASISGYTQKVNVKAEEEKIRASIANWQKISADGGIDNIMYYFADDAIIMEPGRPPVKGKKTIEAMIREMENQTRNSGFKMTWNSPESVTVAESGDLAYIITKNHITTNDTAGKEVTSDNKAVLIWKKQTDKSWKEAVVIFNADPS